MKVSSQSLLVLLWSTSVAVQAFQPLQSTTKNNILPYTNPLVNSKPVTQLFAEDKPADQSGEEKQEGDKKSVQGEVDDALAAAKKAIDDSASTSAKEEEEEAPPKKDEPIISEEPDTNFERPKVAVPPPKSPPAVKAEKKTPVPPTKAAVEKTSSNKDEDKNKVVFQIPKPDFSFPGLKSNSPKDESKPPAGGSASKTPLPPKLDPVSQKRQAGYQGTPCELFIRDSKDR